ncbi:fungal-specific transcription factor domain-containing protein [Trametes maxima]|nr:fungal-specific transcription factor domain-containing protein [Trametes maxima]
MSSPEEEPTTSQAGASKKRKVIQRACDYCRRKKIKCDGPRMPNKRCSKCISRNAECTYIEPFNKPRYPDGYVENLEKRLQKLEDVLTKLNPDPDLLKSLENEPPDAPSPKGAPATATPPPRTSRSPPIKVPQLAISPSSPASTHEDEADLSDEDVVMQREAVEGLSKLAIHAPGFRYHGKSSGWMFIQATAGFKQEYIRGTGPTPIRERGYYKGVPKQYELQPWLEQPFTEETIPPGDFPPEDLLESLVNHYFRFHNDHTPLLHEPTFRQNIKDRMHLRVSGFGTIVLLVCALGSRHSDDPRVLLSPSAPYQSAGWKWYQRADSMHKSLLAPVKLYDLQICVLMTLYMYTTTVPHCSWTIVGLGIRKALDVGAHRKTMYKSQPNVNDELWRRAFWALLAIDLTASYGLGRPMGIHEEEYDLPPPTEVDDEYWLSDDPEKEFKQPPDKPSKIAYWNCYIRLAKIIGYASRTIFSLRKSREQLVNGDEQWEERVVAELDSELNKWADTVPEHLRWDPNRENELFLEQSATLHGSYYQVQVSVHRMFITTRRGSVHSLASLIICTNAARSCVQIMEQLRRRVGTPFGRNAGPLFMSGLVLLMSMWGQRRTGRHAGADRDQEYIEKCIEMLGQLERENNVAERLKDMLRNFLSVDPPARVQGPAPGSSAESGTSPSSDQYSGRSDSKRAAKEPLWPQQSPTSASPSASPSSQHTYSSPSALPSPPQEPTYRPAPSSTHSAAFELATPTQSSYRAVPDPLTAESSMNWQQRQSIQPQFAPMQSFSNFGAGQANAGPSTQGQWSNNGENNDFLAGTGVVPFPNTGAELQDPMGLMGSSAFPMDISPAFAAPLNTPGEADFAMPDYAFVADTMTMWSDAPSSFGWEDWDAYFNAVNGTRHAGG